MASKPLKKMQYHDLMQKMRVNPIANQGLEDYFTSSSGDRLFYRAWPAKNTEKIVLGIHGLAAHGEFFVLVADQVIQNDIAVYALDLKGHGRSSGPKGDIINFRELIDQVNEFISYLKIKHPGIPIFLMGQSMGGCLSINLAAIYPDAASGLILTGPAVKTSINFSITDILQLPCFALIYPFKKEKPLVNIAKRQKVSSRNPLRQEYDQVDDYRLKKISIRYLLQVNKWVKKAFRSAPNLTCPVLVIQGTGDLLVPPEAVRDFFDKLKTTDKQFIELKDAFHCTYSDPAIVEQGGWLKMREWLKMH
ncbi:MAG: alpha/beta fold hydrolase [Candidatus Helarchaeota archaeon]